MRSVEPEIAISRFVVDLEYADLSDAVTETITRAYVDTVGVILAGTEEGAGRVATESAGIDSATADAATLLGVDASDSPEDVAMRIGTASHGIDYDDLSWAMSGHPSVTLVPALLALANEVAASGRDLITAYAAGFEAECAVAAPINPEHYEAGWHATATIGTFGAAAAVANLLDLDQETTAHTLNIAASTPAGLKRNFGSMTKPLHAGLCSRSGVTAARLAAGGFTANETAISGSRGFWDLYGPAERGEFSIGERWALEERGIHVKAYPCCYFTHTSIAAAQALVATGLDPEVIDRVCVTASPGAGDALQHADPDTGLEAKFSMEYAVASAIVRDRVGIETFHDAALDAPQVQHVREQIAFSVDESLPYDSHAATVRIETDTDTVERTQENPPGTHDDPLSDAELRDKFEECAGTVLSDDAVDELYDVVSSLSAQSDVSSAIAALRRS